MTALVYTETVADGPDPAHATIHSLRGGYPDHGAPRGPIPACSVGDASAAAYDQWRYEQSQRTIPLHQPPPAHGWYSISAGRALAAGATPCTTCYPEGLA